MTGMIIAAVVAVPLLIIGIYIGATYNALVKLKNSVEEAFSTMDVYLKKRWDLIPNIVESVKGYAKRKGLCKARGADASKRDFFPQYALHRYDRGAEAAGQYGTCQRTCRHSCACGAIPGFEGKPKLS